MNSEKLLILLLVSPILLTQSILLFIDAKKKGSYAWVWGILGLLQFPCPTIFYYFFVIRPSRRKGKKED
ncbi:Negative regulatory protein yxlD [Virgibacillus soli]|uniref:Negative regulatory protein yxlD n=1 Tax=Lederbergia galactosidilytica TaxID=217031 RepID=A0A177ZIF5_9BACI|nr:hypothetical protein [Lederbergia galactosidilytica]KRG16518.1 Negative regulatory protein yxlD [Virgibacillus soli]MBP1914148.1 hypothetical protein [Lederbergia galactosidilytica]OAK67393.1 Negative regulatory protein yxlD [Lederbergia galactosidilytica]